MTPELLRSLHLAGVVLFVGNIIVTAVWKVLADRTRNAPVVAFGQRLVTVTDLAFTAVGAVLVAVTGQLLAGGREVIFNTPWLAWAYAFFIASGLLWLLVLVPIQLRQARLARGFRDGGEIPPEYWRLARRWAVVGSLATVLPFCNLFLMVVKPV